MPQTTVMSPEEIRRHVGAQPLPWARIMSKLRDRFPSEVDASQHVYALHNEYIAGLRERILHEFKRPAISEDGDHVIRANKLAMILGLSSWNLSQMKSRGRIEGSAIFESGQRRPAHTWEQIEKFLATQCMDLENDRLLSPLWEPFLSWLQDKGEIDFPTLSH